MLELKIKGTDSYLKVKPTDVLLIEQWDSDLRVAVQDIEVICEGNMFDLLSGKYTV